MSELSTFVRYKSGRTEILRHKNKRDMEDQRKALAKLETVFDYRPATKGDKASKEPAA